MEKITSLAKLKSQKVLIISVVVGLLAVLLVFLYVRAKEKELSVGPEVEVVVARKDIPAGTMLDLSMIAKMSLPEKFLPDVVVHAEDHAKILRQTVNAPIVAGQPILWKHIEMETGKVKLAATLEKGQRAVTIAVEDITGIAGLLKPNDRVDIVGTFQIPEEVGVISPTEAGGMEGLKTVTRIILQNVTILATGETMAKGVPRERLVPSEEDRELAELLEKGIPYRTVTVAITPFQSEKLIFAMKRGELSLILRHPEDMEIIANLPIVSFKSILGLEKMKEEGTVTTESFTLFIAGEKVSETLMSGTDQQKEEPKPISQILDKKGF